METWSDVNGSIVPSLYVIEYLSTGKPVVHFAEIEDDPVVEISKKYPNLLVISKELDKEEFIKKLNNLFANIYKFSNEAFLEEFSPRTLVNKLDFI